MGGSLTWRCGRTSGGRAEYAVPSESGDRMEDATDRIAALKGLTSFTDLDREDLEDILRTGQLVSFGAEEPLVERGDPGEAMYILLSGTAEVDVGGRFHRIEPGDFLGEMAIMAGKERLATVKAVGDVQALRISATDFEDLLLRRPHVAVTILKTTVERLREVQQRIDAWIGVW
jgi:CRP-like cAMP-binding protein